TIGELAVEREKRRRELFGYEQGGSWMAARDARRQLASVDAELNALIDSVIAEETAALAAK
ncbi:MAG TPA: hypothetical protein VM818_17515, partial [Vicinamibacterales bacterium]|nr:hypothetical protein [Vicinamibacterales bacterium]